MRKSGSAEKFGLTVCYSSGSGSEDLDTEVYISEIVPESLAARDGRLREGDQILQVKIRNFLTITMCFIPRTLKHYHNDLPKNYNSLTIKSKFPTQKFKKL